MQIVIDMPPKEFEHFKQFKGKFICDNGYDLIQAIKNGTPLPEGHGDLVDFDKLCEEYWDGNYLEIHCNELASIHPIIEADKAESEDK